MKKALVGIVALTALATVGCSFHARSPEKYRADTRALLETRSANIKACYDGVLKADESAGGMVTLKFTVQKKTGQIVDVHVDEQSSSASPQLQECVKQAVAGLALTPPDERDGLATFVYEFRAQG